MKLIKYFIREISLTGDFRGLLETYEELAAEEMKQIREKILNSREFLENLAKLSVRVGADWQTAFKSRNKPAAVFLSADEGLYGDLIEKVFFNFLEFVKKNQIKAVVIGRVGQELMDQWGEGLEVEYWEENVTTLAKLLTEFSELKVFYGQFKNVASQLVMNQSVSGKAALAVIDSVKDGVKQTTKYIYEPSIKKIAQKFNQEIMMTVLNGMVEENRLAKQAARLIQLDETMDRIEDRLSSLKLKKRQLSKKLEDSKQQDRIKKLVFKL